MSDPFREECIKLDTNTKKQIEKMEKEYQYQKIRNEIRDLKDTLPKRPRSRGLGGLGLANKYRMGPERAKLNLLNNKRNMIMKKIKAIQTKFNWMLFDLVHKHNKNHSDMDEWYVQIWDD